MKPSSVHRKRYSNQLSHIPNQLNQIETDSSNYDVTGSMNFGQKINIPNQSLLNKKKQLANLNKEIVLKSIAFNYNKKNFEQTMADLRKIFQSNILAPQNKNGLINSIFFNFFTGIVNWKNKKLSNFVNLVTTAVTSLEKFDENQDIYINENVKPLINIFIFDNITFSTSEEHYRNTFSFLKSENQFYENCQTKHKLINTLLLLGILILCSELKTPTLRNFINNLYAKLKPNLCPQEESGSCSVCFAFYERIQPFFEKKNVFNVTQFSKIANLDKYVPYHSPAPNSSRDSLMRKSSAVNLRDRERDSNKKKVASPEPKFDLLKLPFNLIEHEKVKTLRESSSRLNPSTFQSYIKQSVNIREEAPKTSRRKIDDSPISIKEDEISDKSASNKSNAMNQSPFKRYIPSKEALIPSVNSKNNSNKQTIDVSISTVNSKQKTHSNSKTNHLQQVTITSNDGKTNLETLSEKQKDENGNGNDIITPAAMINARIKRMRLLFDHMNHDIKDFESKIDDIKAILKKK